MTKLLGTGTIDVASSVTREFGVVEGGSGGEDFGIVSAAHIEHFADS